MSNAPGDQAVVLILVSTIRQRSCARLLIDSVRSFGGALSRCPIWLLEADPQRAPCGSLESMGVQVLPLTVPETVSHLWFSGKVYACARAEELAAPGAKSLIWLSSDCLVIKPPLLLDLASSFDAAVRPVHIRNIGLLSSEPLDGFWKRVYEAVGVNDIQATVESFVDRQHIRAYFNSHALAVNPSEGLFRQWFESFQSLVCDQEFQSGHCQDQLHQIFLHQAILSALIATKLDPPRICTLPPDYSYPYNLHGSIPLDRRASALNDLVCIAYEDRSLDPGVVNDININEPLRSWLSIRAHQIQLEA